MRDAFQHSLTPSFSPGGSVKDRAALFLIRNFEEKGLIGPGGTVVEGTAGNTGTYLVIFLKFFCLIRKLGIGLAHICKARGYKCVIFMPNTQSQEKINLLKALGAEVIAVPAVPYEVQHPETSERIEKQMLSHLLVGSKQLQSSSKKICRGEIKLCLDESIRQCGEQVWSFSDNGT